MSDEEKKSLGELYTALSAAQAAMGSGVGKDRSNPHFGSTYSTLAAVLSVAMPELTRHGLALLQYREGSDLITRLGHKSGAELITTYPLKPSRDNEQGWGSAITYARRYQAMAMLGLAPEDDDGNEASQQQRQPAKGKTQQATQKSERPKAQPDKPKPAPLPNPKAALESLGAHGWTADDAVAGLNRRHGKDGTWDQWCLAGDKVQTLINDVVAGRISLDDAWGRTPREVK